MRHGIFWIGGIYPNWISQIPEPDATFGEIMDEVQSVPNGSTQAIQRMHDNHVAFASLVKCRLKARPIRSGP
ncbi:hypothetical protein FM101_05140 [Arthrobacter rhombi]|uniref:Uncharacterized protein n=1 Tax=Arthrobacter rhombi TaxID=71253 RepID=A0A1R4FPV7_9MICC|nr:hypothetical protein FM101_05140 [Arthrobacter rhombi]